MALKIRVRLFFNYQKYGPEGQGDFELNLFLGATVEQVLDSLGLPNETKVVLINGRQAESDQVMQSGDLLVVFPPIEGG
jgi:sulfur carrier protein ThiS